MAIMYPTNISEYMPNASERIVYDELKKQLPDSFSVFYSVEWSRVKNGKMEKSEADFIITHPDYGFLCLEVKGGQRIYIEDNIWYVEDSKYGPRKLHRSPYKQAEESMYYFKDIYTKNAGLRYNGIYAAGAVFPFFSIENIATEISDRQTECTIDSSKMDSLYEAIKQMFKSWGGSNYGLSMYSKSEHDALLDCIRKRVAIAAAAGSLIKYKEQQMEMINRVQDNYIYFLENYNQFYIRGGAGTGKTWIAIKMANQEALKQKRVLVTCVSKNLADMIQTNVAENVEVKTLDEIIRENLIEPDKFSAPDYVGCLSDVKDKHNMYDAIFIDEAQDLNEETACLIKYLLADEKNSKLGVFYDDVQKIRSDSFGDAFMIELPPFLLRENIRNTANIYNYAMESTNLGQDVIRNPVEGPTPKSEKIRDNRHLTQRLENLLKEFIVDEKLDNNSIIILFENIDDAKSYIEDGLADWKFVFGVPQADNEIQISGALDFKGLESDMVIYVRGKDTSDNLNYIAYTRAKYYLYELIK